MSTATIPMTERPKFGELDLFTQLAARVAEVEKSARDDLRVTNQEIRELREAVAAVGKRLDEAQNRETRLASRVGVAETMAKDARDAATAAEILLDGMTGPAKAEELIVAKAAVPGDLDPDQFMSVSDFIRIGGMPERRGMTPKGIAKVMGVAATVLGARGPKVHGNMSSFPVFLLRSFARFIGSSESEGIGMSGAFTQWAMAEDRSGILRGQ